MNSSVQMRSTRIVILATVSILAAEVSTARTVYVTNDGADSGSRGAKATPCRSISQAIENASAGDTIGVGAGRYGNISGDGTFSHPGDEHPQSGGPPHFVATAGCIVCVNKALTIQSLHGASVTVIEGIPSTDFPATVLVMSYNVHFGTPGAGFTVTGGNTYGVRVDQNAISSAQFHPPGVTIVFRQRVDAQCHCQFRHSAQRPGCDRWGSGSPAEQRSPGGRHRILRAPGRSTGAGCRCDRRKRFPHRQSGDPR